MKKRRLYMIVAVLSLIITMGHLGLIEGISAKAAEEGVDIDKNFPDSVFRKYVRDNIDLNGDGKLSNYEISMVAELDLNRKGIYSLQGIGVFTSLTKLECEVNNLSSLDMSQNTKLKWLNCSSNQIKSLNVSQNSLLEVLDCNANQLSVLGLDVSKNTRLKSLACSYCQLSYVDLSKNTNLLFLDCCDNLITELDLSKNTLLEDVLCFQNSELKTLVLGNNAMLRFLNCRSNQLSQLNLVGCIRLERLDCSNNVISSLNLTNNKELKELWCYYNELKSLNLSACKKLEELGCELNQLTTLSLVNNSALTFLGCSYNKLTILDVSKCSLLTDISCEDNQLTELDVSKNQLLRYLNCYKNQIQELDISNNPNLESLTYTEGMNVVRIKFTTAPKNIAVVLGDTASFKAVARGVSSLSYQWQVWNESASAWTYPSAASSRTSNFSFTVSQGHNGKKFRCVVTDEDGNQVVSDTVVLTVKSPITTQPKSASVLVGNTASFSIVTETTKAYTYQWQAYNPNTKTWVNSASTSAKTAILTLTVQAAHNGFKFRCIVTDSKGNKTTSAAATLTVMTPPMIVTQPKPKTVPVGGTAEFTIAAKGAGTLKYQWQAYNPNTKQWVNSSSASAKTSTLSITAQTGHHGFKFRCIVTDGNGNSTTSSAAQLTVRPGIVTQPKDVTVSTGGTVKLTVSAKSVGSLSYQWQVWDTATETWKNSLAASAKTANFTFTAQKGHNGKKFRCVLTDSNGNQTVTRGALVTVK